MGSVPTLLTQRWRSRRLVGDAAHSCLIRIRQGYMNHFYESATMLPTSPSHHKFPSIWKGHNKKPWQGQWTPTGDWINIFTNIESANWTRTFEDQGTSTATILIDNIVFNEATGEAGIYHTINRGWFSPTRGVKVNARPSLWEPNGWEDVFNGGFQIELWEGYGIGDDVIPVLDEESNTWSAPSASKTWGGLIETCELESHPDHVTLTCTDFNVMATDQRVMGQNKANEIQSPITFADRRKSAHLSRRKGWILIDDAADIVRICLLWMGFHEMDVQNFGWTIEEPIVFGQDSFFVDIINEVLTQGNYVYYMDPPTDHDMSIGVPVFKPQEAVIPAPEGIVSISDKDMTEALNLTWDLSNLPYVIRYRGALSSKGKTLFEDLSKRWMGTYWPPWSGHDYTNLQGKDFQGPYPTGRGGGVRRHFSQTVPGLTSVTQCLFACILTAIQYALAAVTGTCQISGYPGIKLNDQISIVDEGTGTNTRMWVISIDSTHTLGENGSWHMSIGGSIIDTDDMAMIQQDYAFTYKRYVIDKQSS